MCARVADDPGAVDDGRELLTHWRSLRMLPVGTPANFSARWNFSGKCIPIRAGRPAHNARAKLVASMARGILPGPVIGHWPSDAKEPLIVVGDDEEERRGLFGHAAAHRDSCVTVARQDRTRSIPSEARK